MRTVRLADVSDLTVGFVGSMVKHYVDKGVPFIRSMNVEPFRLNYNDLKYISPEFNDRLSKSKLHKGDVVIVRTGKPGACAVIPDDYEEINCSDLVIVRPHTEELDSLYAACYINNSYRTVNAHLVGAVQQHFNVKVAGNLEMNLPPLSEQKRIAEIIGKLNEKIIVNESVNENLLQQASTIYQAWFEDFILFDGICPEEWKQGDLSDIANITSGKRPPLKSAEKTDIATIPLVGAASVMGFTSESNHTDKILVIGRVGTHGVVQRFNTSCWTSDNTLVITSALYEYTYQILQRIDYHAMNRGSTQPLITQGDMNKIAILIPDRQTLDDFEALVGQLMLQYEANLLENTKLSELRDALLPRLMSGELDVSNIDL